MFKQSHWKVNFSFDGNTYANSKEEKILGIIIITIFNLIVISKKCLKKISQKRAALSRLVSYLELGVRKLILNSMIKS